MPLDLSRVQSVFQAVAELSSAERSAVLERECGGDLELRRHVEALLRAHDDSGELPAAGPEPTAAYVPMAEPGQVFVGSGGVKVTSAGSSPGQVRVVTAGSVVATTRPRETTWVGRT